MHRFPGWLIAGITLIPCAANAQIAPQWALEIKPGETLLITTQPGERLEGAASGVAGDGIDVRTSEGLKTARYRDILKVQRRDAVRNGVLIGAGLGAAIASIPLVYGNECRYETCGSQLGFPIAGVVAGAAIGWAIDGAIKGWTTIFDAGARATVSARPVRGGFAVQGALTWR